MRVKRHHWAMLAGSILFSLAACVSPRTIPAASAVPAEHVFRQVGQASWYGAWHEGKATASGEVFDPAKLTAAHRTLPLDTRIRVTNLENGRSVVLRVNDRGPYKAQRILDVSSKAAETLGMKDDGLATVRIEAVDPQLVKSQ